MKLTKSVDKTDKVSSKQVVYKTDEVSSKYSFEVLIVDKTDKVSSKQVVYKTDEVSSKYSFEVVDRKSAQNTVLRLWIELTKSAQNRLYIKLTKSAQSIVLRLLDRTDEVSNHTYGKAT
ncbi:3-ketoacyl-ACP reductase [Streptococcus pneumoniae]|nr:3-ketoacyl-ACP reductase [Streptococcus pneumoniae]